MSVYNRAAKALHTARSDWWEAGHYIDGAKHRERRHAKHAGKRAQRRLDKALIAEVTS